MDLNDIFEKEKREREERLKNGIQTTLHLLKFQESDLTIQIRLKTAPNSPYREVDLEQCVEASSLLGYIFDLHGKEWNGDNEVTNAFLTLFDDALDVIFSDKIYAERLSEGATLDWKTKTVTFPSN